MVYTSGLGVELLSKQFVVDIGELENVVVEIKLPIPLDRTLMRSFVDKFVDTLFTLLNILSVTEV